MSVPDLLRLGGIVFVAVTFVVLGDTAGKVLTASGVSPIFVAASRFLVGVILLLPISGLRWAEFGQLRDWRLVLRGGVIAAGIACILTALRTEPIANVFGAFFIGPLVSYVLAVLFLGERGSLGRTILLGIGFVGVLLVVKPGFGATTGIAFALLAGVFYGIYLAMTRLVAGSYRPRFLLMSQLLIGSVLLSPALVTVEWPALRIDLWLLVLASAAGSAVGNYLLVLASRRGEASLIAPLVYTQLISATVVGVAIFGDWPDALALVGLGLILVSGLAALALTRAGR